MTFPTGFQSLIDSTPTPANLLDQQPLASLIFPGGGWRRGGSQDRGSSSSEPIHSLGEMWSYFKLCSPESLLICRFVALSAFSALSCRHGEVGNTAPLNCGWKQVLC